MSADLERDLSAAIDQAAADLKPRTFRQRMDQAVDRAEQMLEATKRMLDAAEALLKAVQDAHEELK